MECCDPHAVSHNANPNQQYLDQLRFGSLGFAKDLCMVDNRTKESRSSLMSRIGSKHTKPELTVRSLLHNVGYRFRLHWKELPGKPDIVFIGRRKAIFVHGCYWHGHGCKIGKPPKSNLEFWLPKIERNRERDAQKGPNWSRLAGRSKKFGSAKSRTLRRLPSDCRTSSDPKNFDRHPLNVLLTFRR
ncbi:MAG: very short patch repair endonuclease [Qipengyuania sp.]|uniref:very short patch repair endonuclease n=1 Tax=Qipengyuania sp. TaxID=2004515 RepID=UPI00300246FB